MPTPIRRFGPATSIAAVLLALAAAPAHADPNQDEALVQAARAGQLDSVNALLKAGASPGLDADGIAPLGVAAAQGHVAVMQTLLAAKADPNLKDVNGDTPLLHAAASARLEAVKVLLAAGADPDARSRPEGRSVMFSATMSGAYDIALLLLQAGADGNAATRIGDTPLRWVVGGNTPRHLELVRALLAAHVNVEAGQFPSDKLPPTSCNPVPQGVDSLQELAVNIRCVRDLRSPEGTPLGLAASSGSMEIVQALLAARANVDARQPGWRTPLMIAAAKGRADVVRLLLASGADVAAKDATDQTAAMLAAAQPQVLELLRVAAAPTAIRTRQ